MLQDAKTFTSFSVSNLDEAKEFYTNILGLNVLDDSIDGVVLYQTGGDTRFMIYIKDNHVAATYTVLNFDVQSVGDEVKNLNEKGISMEKYPDMGTDEIGISSTPDGHKMAWFKDPFGNIISLLGN